MRKNFVKAIVPLMIVAASLAATAQAAPQLDIKLPLLPKSVRFAVIGDSGTGDREQYDIARELETYRQKVGFDFVIMLGDNIYGSHDPGDFARKFEQPYKPLLDAGVKFYASLGNHDDPDVERRYKPFNMNGERYYKFSKGNDVDFFVLDSNYMDPQQLKWVGDQLQASKAKWKIAYFHHPLYNFGKHHGADLDLRAQLAPLFQKFGVNVVFSGHEHVYERIKPVDNIYYFVMGSSGKLMTKDIKGSDQLVKSFDTDQGFMLVEISGDQLFFQTVSRKWQTIDSGVVARQNSKATATTAAE
jgi:predicted phosphodiesterase